MDDFEFNNMDLTTFQIDEEAHDLFNFEVLRQKMHNNNEVHRSIEEIPSRYRHIFQFPYFNKVQSKIMDDALYSDRSLVISAPTGSGKTAIFEMAIVNLLIQLEKVQYSGDFKIIYVAPLKALCTERLMDWHAKFNQLGIPCIEATGDSDSLDFNQLKSYKIIFTTPEKWDSLTRRWKDNVEIVEVIKLFIIDEIHLLNEEVRGPVLEAVVSRMKTIQESLKMRNYIRMKEIEKTLENTIISTGVNFEDMNNMENSIRFIAASATIPNAEDIGEWLSTRDNIAICHKIGEEYRSVKLIKIVEGYPYRDGQGVFKFDLFLTYRLKSIIEKHSKGKPTLIFCNTRKSATFTAETLAKESLFNFSNSQSTVFKEAASHMSDKKLQNLMINGIGCHHAGLLLNDRNIVEQIFRQGDLPILVTTSTLAMGVNLPAHLVIIKTTQHYINGAYTEYEESTVLQMMGRAGRPQFDTEGVAVIMTTIKDKPKYERLCGGSRAVESKLHRHLYEHLNAEVALGTLPDLLLAMDWLRSTFLYVRATRNPAQYGCGRLDGRESIEKRLQEMCVKCINALARAGILIIDDDTRIKSTDAGILMATHCLDFDSMKLIMKINGNESLNDFVSLISNCHEFEDVVVRAGEKRCLNALNKSPRATPCCRFTLPGRVQTKQMKANCLMQAVFGCLHIPDPSLNQEATKIMRTGERIVKCLVAYVTRPAAVKCGQPMYKSLVNSITLAKCFAAKMWENSQCVSRQLTGIGPAFAAQLVAAGKISFDAIRQSNPRDLERIINKGPPAGNALKKQADMLPIYSMKLKMEAESVLCLMLTIVNGEILKSHCPTTGNAHRVSLVVGDSENRLLHYSTLSDIHLLNMPNYTINKKVPLFVKTSHNIYAHCISNTWVGLDVYSSISIKELSSKERSPLSYDIRNYISVSNSPHCSSTIVTESPFFSENCDVIESSQKSDPVSKRIGKVVEKKPKKIDKTKTVVDTPRNDLYTKINNNNKIKNNIYPMSEQIDIIPDSPINMVGMIGPYDEWRNKLRSEGKVKNQKTINSSQSNSISNLWQKKKNVSVTPKSIQMEKTPVLELSTSLHQIDSQNNFSNNSICHFFHDDEYNINFHKDSDGHIKKKSISTNINLHEDIDHYIDNYIDEIIQEDDSQNQTKDDETMVLNIDSGNNIASDSVINMCTYDDYFDETEKENIHYGSQDISQKIENITYTFQNKNFEPDQTSNFNNINPTNDLVNFFNNDKIKNHKLFDENNNKIREVEKNNTCSFFANITSEKYNLQFKGNDTNNIIEYFNKHVPKMDSREVLKRELDIGNTRGVTMQFKLTGKINKVIYGSPTCEKIKRINIDQKGIYKNITLQLNSKFYNLLKANLLDMPQFRSIVLNKKIIYESVKTSPTLPNFVLTDQAKAPIENINSLFENTAKNKTERKTEHFAVDLYKTNFQPNQIVEIEENEPLNRLCPPNFSNDTVIINDAKFTDQTDTIEKPNTNDTTTENFSIKDILKKHSTMFDYKNIAGNSKNDRTPKEYSPIQQYPSPKKSHCSIRDVFSYENTEISQFYRCDEEHFQAIIVRDPNESNQKPKSPRLNFTCESVDSDDTQKTHYSEDPRSLDPQWVLQNAYAQYKNSNAAATSFGTHSKKARRSEDRRYRERDVGGRPRWSPYVIPNADSSPEACHNSSPRSQTYSICNSPKMASKYFMQFERERKKMPQMWRARKF